MADIATLGLAVDSRPVATANDNLEKLGRTAAKTERSTEGFERGARKAGTATDRMARDVNRADKAMATMRRTMIGLAASFGGIVGASLAMRKFVDASIEAQRVQAQLAASLKSTAGASGQTIASLNDHAAALQKVTTFGDEATNAAQGILLTFTRIGGPEFAKATEAVQNVATAMGQDLKSAAIQVGKALNDPVQGMTALSRSGITFSEAQKEVVKQMVATGNIIGAQTLILKELETQFGGSARAARETLGGALSALGNAWGDLFELAGGATEGLRSAIESLVTAISSPGFTAFIGAIGTALLAALTAAAMATNVLVSGLSILGDNLDVIGVAAGTAGALMVAAFGPAIFSGIVSGFVAMGSAGVAAISAITAAMAANPLGALIVGLTVAVTAAYYFRDEIKQAIGIDVVQTAKDAANFIIGVFVGSFNAIVATFGKLPAAFGDLAYQAGYQFADHIRYWINEAILLIDSFITTMNDKLGTSVARPSVLRPVGYNNPFAGAASDAASTAAAAFNGALDVDYIGMIGKAFEDATPPVKDFSGSLEGAADAAEGVGTASGKSAKDTKKALKDVETDAEKAAKTIESTLGSVLADLFSKPIKDFDDFMDRITSGFAQLGQANLQKAFDGMFSGGRTAANDNFQANTTLGEFLGKSVEKGAKLGTAEGGFKAFLTGFQTLFGGGQQGAGGQANGGALSAGLGGFGMGYQSQSPVTGGLGGALSGFAAGGPIGAIVGGVAGLLGGLFGGNSAKRKERAEANSQLNQNTATIEQLFAAGQGRGIGEYANAVREFYDETAKIDQIAQKAGDHDLVKRLRQNVNDFFLLMEKDFIRSWDGMVDALNDGLGSNSPFVKGKESIEGLRDELKNFVADTQAMGDLQIKHGRDTDAATVAAQVETARQAAQTMALAVLGGAKTLSTMEAEVLRLDGVAAGLQVTLEELGMSAETADKAISASLSVSIAKLRDTFRADINASINELSGFGYLNDIAEAQIVYQQRLSDAAALGLDGSLAARELSLSLQEIVSSAGLTTAEINMVAGAFPELAGMVATSTVSLTSAQNDLRAAYDAQASALDDVIDRTESFIETIRKFRDNMRLSASSPLSPEQRMLEAQRQFRSVSALAATGDENAQSQLTGISQAYLDEARSYYASSENYMRIWEEVDATLAGTQTTAERQLTESQKQLAALNAQVSGLITINTSVLSVGAAISQLAGAQSALGTQIAAMASTGSDAIGAAYQSSLGRAGGAPEIAWWQSQVAAGKSVDWAVSEIANSAEAQALKSIRGFASGGMHMGGLRLVGENGPEIEATGPSRIYSAQQTRAMLANDNSAVVAELRELRAENARLSKAVERLGSLVKLSDEETRKVIREGNETMAETSSALKKVASR